MILDEPVASLDPEGERAVFELFAQMNQAKVILFTTHRYDSIPAGTKILVLVDGRIAEVGTHDELFQRRRHYWSLYMACAPSAGDGRDTPTLIPRDSEPDRSRSTVLSKLILPRPAAKRQIAASGARRPDTRLTYLHAPTSGGQHVR
jgi:ABC-type multidrug transport system ATPase subunit